MKWPKVMIVPWDSVPAAAKLIVGKAPEPETGNERIERMYRNVIALATGRKAVTENGEEVAVAPYVDIQQYKRRDESAPIGADLVSAVLVRITVPGESVDKEMHWLQEGVLDHMKRSIEEPWSAYGIQLRRKLSEAGVRFIQLQECRSQWVSITGKVTRTVASCAIPTS